MNKFNYSTFDSSNTDVVFSTDNSYGDPASEAETRKQLSYPFKEVKTYINNTIPTNSSDNPVQLVVTSEGMKYRTEVGGTLTAVPGALQMSTVIDTIYPVGSVYLSVSSTNPSTLFTGTTWEQITTDAYLKIVTSNAGQAGGTSSNHKIPLSSIPSHTHSYTVSSGAYMGQTTSPYDVWKQLASTSGTTGSAGSGNAYYPYYIGVYVWKRTA